jgi:UDP-N-acetylmuramyl pentapeptide phosphotransferase/UDP-N-acetylglucosamine-1-phosphate transferase
MTALWAVRAIATAAFSAVVCAGLIVLLRPLLARYALARPNARSSHREPTPQGGGIAVIVATIAAAYLGVFALGVADAAPPTLIVAAVILMACIGAIDDIRTIPVGPRLFLQAVAVVAAIYALPDELRVIAGSPWWLERALLFVGGLWFVNLVNFMDGIDWMTVAEVTPITAGLIAAGWLGALPLAGAIVALAIGGAMIGFAYFNRPVAKLFLGDVGSLPIGLLLGWLLALLAGNGHLAAALLLPLYYLADATITLLRRLLRGEQVWQAHRSHFYQIATERGMPVMAVVTRVFLVNSGLAVLAIVTVIAPARTSDVGALIVGVLIVGLLLAAFTKGKR